ncbi:MAG: DeoR/GlpR transcriptional regulator [Ruminococcaceae bacterium]|nr:DeoR/GlpR transcriptional regulator [Oscillospiraceae bacterium]
MNSVRRNQIRELLQSKPFISLHELEELFPDVSSMTLRRDIEYFEKQGEAIKVRGGARSMKFITTSMEDAFSLRMHENAGAKERIAHRALGLLETGRSIFLDSGTTMLRLAEILPDERITVTTTGLNVAIELMKKDMPIVNIVGGMINRDNITVSGNQAVSFIDSINIDLAFIVPSGVSAKDGLTCGNFIECELKKLVVEKARKVVLLMDSSKLNKSLPYTFCSIDDIDCIVSDEELPYDITERAARAGISILIA